MLMSVKQAFCGKGGYTVREARLQTKNEMSE